jgi:hypothetical protein
MKRADDCAIGGNMTHITRGKKPTGRDSYNTKSPSKGSKNLTIEGSRANKLMAATSPKVSKTKKKSY